MSSQKEITKQDLKKIEDYLFEIPKTFRSDMKVPARIYTDEKMLDQIVQDRSLEQIVNVTTLPGIVKHSLAMPDIHEGYGFPIGGVAATDIVKGGVISPGGIGYDINCGVRILTSQIVYDEIKSYLQEIMNQLFQNVPSGEGRGGELVLDYSEVNKVLEEGVSWAVKKGYATKEDQEHTEDAGHMSEANSTYVSSRAKERGKGQLGSLGGGNHFLEVQKVVKIFDKEIAKLFGLFENQITVMIHCGSRGLGHQVCTDYIRTMVTALDKYKIILPDRELVCVPFESSEGEKYFGAMAAAANYAWTNRQIILNQVRQVWEEILGGKVKNTKLEMIYDVAHNIGKREKHLVDGKEMDLCVHRKGATRAFAPGRPEVPEVYQKVGQPVIIPGCMGTSSFVLVGTQKVMEKTWGSVCHGAGRTMSRNEAKRKILGSKLRQDLEKKGIIIRCKSNSGLAEEAPMAYKDINEVVNIVCKAGLAKKVAQVVPVGVMKG
jgi:tRNA-splicing ligase RtcB